MFSWKAERIPWEYTVQSESPGSELAVLTWERVRGYRLRVLAGNALLETSAGRIMTGLFVEVCTGLWDAVRMSRYPGRLVAATAGGCFSLGLKGQGERRQGLRHVRSCGWCRGPLPCHWLPVAEPSPKQRKRNSGAGVRDQPLWKQRKVENE